MPLLGTRVNRASEDLQSPSALHLGHILAGRAPLYTDFLQPHQASSRWSSADQAPSLVCALSTRRICEWYQRALNVEMGALLIPSIPLIYADWREPTSGLEPLYCSLRVIGHTLQWFAQGCKCRISRRHSLLCLASCCTVLRSRWCQSGVNCTLVSA